MKTLDQLIEEFKGSMKDGNHGRFSRDSFEEMATVILNSNDVREEWSMTGDGEIKKKEYKPSEGLRKFIYNTLKDFGVDSQSAKAVFEDNYEFRKLTGIHEFVSETLYNYAKYRRFNFINGEKFKGSIIIKEQPESVHEFHKIPTEGQKRDENDKFAIKFGDHEVLRVRSSAPDWVKTRL